MRKILVPIAATFLLAAAGMASAADISGKVVDVDITNQTFTLANGMKFNVESNVNLNGIEEGAEVKVTYEEKGGKNVASAISQDVTGPMRHRPDPLR